MRIKKECANGKYCMQLISQYINEMPAKTTVEEFCSGVTAYIYKVYEDNGIDIERIKSTPVERLTASAVIYSPYHKQVWMVGDCECIVNGQFYENPKPQESIIAEKRAKILKVLLNKGLTAAEVQVKDPGRDAVINEIIDGCRYQNIKYPVIDGFPIPIETVKVIDVKDDCKEIVLASDGYPYLKNTLAESEELLRKQIAEDPLFIGDFKATKALMNGYISFDDRCYLRFEI